MKNVNYCKTKLPKTTKKYSEKSKNKNCLTSKFNLAKRKPEKKFKNIL